MNEKRQVSQALSTMAELDMRNELDFLFRLPPLPLSSTNALFANRQILCLVDHSPVESVFFCKFQKRLRRGGGGGERDRATTIVVGIEKSRKTLVSFLLFCYCIIVKKQQRIK